MENKEKLTRKEQAEKSKKKIVETTINLLKKYSLNELQIKDICSNADISIGNFYHYFTNKQEIIFYIFNTNADIYKKKILAKDKTNSYKDILYAFKEFAKLVSELGGDLILEIFNYSIMNRNNALLSKDAFFYNHILSLVNSLREVNLVISDDNSDVITKRLIVFFRGFFYEWALSNSNFNLVKETEKEMKLYLSLFIKIN
ncbi:TetR/AcrR family transcriptional regulator [Brachyspira pilosicoli]|uniref:TetR/AcrR family transcriptional regulator n=2 Tax=Brachyspira pilosicoli TaxID=52584 RepID=A0AAJ6G6Q1_BRAPL|nr:TetR/AcrR family transcriptional regulator [Brachyspira pilosicoli]MBW5383388.1 TetR/AcrR family transcriptional regulator [Brachyspira pilosicoli]MBW5393278.1 TetR/AcrR family transcriptional regulator [Brachyspira pilosicoli]MBW5399855.1 TetR/AcrR family transcriptional regulator [Brachyspira pilosicoli]WIH80373.1 TetR/AcrR family transcriptional regulator [Brachyspira pilosicoli]WIH82576.1 TetR/AcrR family transcriptional regulator [Brachyspira pilosicoli]